jgi:hypothetical protein
MMRVLIGAAVLMLAMACAPAAQPTPGTTPTPDPTPTPETTPIPPQTDLPEIITRPIFEDVAERTGVDFAEINVVRAQAVTWPDPSLGCPEPGMVYPQVIVDGYWLVLEVDGTEYDYRGSGVGEFILCEIPQRDRFEPVPGNGGLDY